MIIYNSMTRLLLSILQPTQQSTDMVILSVSVTNTDINRLHYGDILYIWRCIIMHTFTAPYHFICFDVIDWTLHRLKEKWSWTFCYFVPLGRLKRLIRQCLVHFITLIASLALFLSIASASLCFHTCSPLNSFTSSVRKCAYGVLSPPFSSLSSPTAFPLLLLLLSILWTDPRHSLNSLYALSNQPLSNLSYRRAPPLISPSPALSRPLITNLLLALIPCLYLPSLLCPSLLLHGRPSTFPFPSQTSISTSPPLLGGGLRLNIN